MSAWTREDWNDIIRRVNELCENPDPGCQEIDPLEEVDENHKWSVGDIEEVRDKLLEVCDENTFTAETVKWKQDIIDEINAAIDNGWCNCCEDDETESVLLEMISYMLCTAYISICTRPCDGEGPEYPSSTDLCPTHDLPIIYLKDLIDGVQVGEETDEPGSWRVVYRLYNGSTTSDLFIASGIVDTDGIAHYTGSKYLSRYIVDGNKEVHWTCTCINGIGWPSWCCYEWETDQYEVVTQEPVGKWARYVLIVNQCLPK